MTKNVKILLSFILATVVLVIAITGLIVGIFTSVPDFKELKTGKVKVAIRLANGEKSFRWVGPTAPDWVPSSQIAEDVLMAVIASEDAAFFSHNGVDLHELKEAIKKDFEEKRWARGASTLTQQVIKNAYLTSEKTLWRKFKEILWARELEKVLTKAEILSFYANMAEFGPGIYGIKEATNHYFDVPPSALTARQSAFMAMLLPSPRRYHSYYQRKQMSPWASGRVNRILQIMNRMGFLDDAAYASALRERLWGETEQLVPIPPTDNEPLGEDLPQEEDAPIFQEKENNNSPESAPTSIAPPIEDGASSESAKDAD